MLLSTTQGFVARWSGHPDKLIFGLQYGKINTKETVYKAGWLGKKGSLIRACSSACFYLSLPSQVTLRQEDTKGEKNHFFSGGEETGRGHLSSCGFQVREQKYVISQRHSWMVQRENSSEQLRLLQTLDCQRPVEYNSTAWRHRVWKR